MSNFMGVGIFSIGLNRADLGCWRLTLTNASNILFFLFFQRNRCTREFDSAVLWPKMPKPRCFKNCNICLQEDRRVGCLPEILEDVHEKKK